jgi:prepilin-type N-terminal cleavage/methylation domain-containing protein
MSSKRFSPAKITSRLTNQRGVTLIETVVALSLFAISAATMGDFLTHQFRAAGTNNNYTVAHEVGVEELENIRSLLFEEITSEARQIQKGGMSYEIETTVEDNTPGANMKRISVDVGWNEPDGERHVVLETIYTAVSR